MSSSDAGYSDDDVEKMTSILTMADTNEQNQMFSKF